MKNIEIYGENYIGECTKERVGVRGIVIRDNEILLYHETKTDVYMIPGGGIEEGETDEECCVREIQEETGYRVEVLEGILEIDEYYEDTKWVNKYYLCKILTFGEMNPTDGEKICGAEKVWLKVPKILNIFSEFEKYKNNDEMMRGLYYREFTALKEALKHEGLI